MREYTDGRNAEPRIERETDERLLLTCLRKCGLVQRSYVTMDLDQMVPTVGRSFGRGQRERGVQDPVCCLRHCDLTKGGYLPVKKLSTHTGHITTRERERGRFFFL